MNEPNNKPLRGFAAMDPEKRKEIARKGGQAVPPEKRAFSVNKALAAHAGSIGGKAVDPAKRSFSQFPNLASEAGRKGGTAAKRPRND